VNALATVDLSAFYVDVTKDRMYTFGARSAGRRSGQTTMYLMSDALARLLAPILPVTADELWQALPGTRSASVHLEEFPKLPPVADDDLMATWGSLMSVRDQVNAALEEARQAQLIGMRWPNQWQGNGPLVAATRAAGCRSRGCARPGNQDGGPESIRAAREPGADSGPVQPDAGAQLRSGIRFHE
jgi:hypothetical protein